jgi:hypothetical protein
MTDLETLSSQLAAEGFYVHLRRQPDGWHCDLYNAVIPHVIPSADGPTALDAVLNANWIRVREQSRG